MIWVSVVMMAIAICVLLAVRYWLRIALVRRMETTVEMLQRVAAGDLSHAIETGADNEIGKMLRELEKMRVSLTNTITGIREGVVNIHSNAREIAQGNSDLPPVPKNRLRPFRRRLPAWSKLKPPYARMRITHMRRAVWQKGQA